MRDPFLLLAALTLSLAGCDTGVYSPSARLATLEVPATIGKGRVAVGGHIASVGSDSVVDALDVEGQVRMGLSAQTELSVALGAMSFERSPDFGGEREATLTHARLGLKYAPEITRNHLAIAAGVGGGRADTGSFFASDVSLIAGYDNRYVIPFVSYGVGLSSPLSTESVELLSRVDDEPETTWSTRASAGARIPFHGEGDVQRFALTVGLFMINHRHQAPEFERDTGTPIYTGRQVDERSWESGTTLQAEVLF